jgi:hypothetical protein
MVQMVQIPNAKPVKTEDTGIRFENAICDACGIPYEGKYKYDKTLSEKLVHRLSPLKELFPGIRHTGTKGARYDFTSHTGHLSAKSCKKNGKVAPQVIGQATPQKFCELIQQDFTTVGNLKEYIQKNINCILPVLEEHTFDNPILYYLEKEDSIRLIELNERIRWTSYTYQWTRPGHTWSNSSTLKIKHDDKYIPLLEIQFHTKRKNMAIRWSFENFLKIFHRQLTVKCF